MKANFRFFLQVEIGEVKPEYTKLMDKEQIDK